MLNLILLFVLVTSVFGSSLNLFINQQPWTKDVSALPKSNQSDLIINALNAAGGWGNGRLQIDFSINLLEVNASTSRYSWSRTSEFYSPDCDCSSIPVPVGGALEGENGYKCTTNGDCHLLVADRGSGLLWEMWRANMPNGVPDSSFQGGCMAVWNLKAPTYPSTLRGAQCTSADAGGFPMSAMLFNADEVAGGSIDHAIRFILPNARIRRKVYVAPGTHSTSATSGGANLPPYGARFRLKPSFNLTVLTPQARVIARALQKYGMLLSDGGTIALTAQSDKFTKAKWSNLGINSMSLTALKPTDFEVVDMGPPISYTGNCVRNSGAFAPVGLNANPPLTCAAGATAKTTTAAGSLNVVVDSSSGVTVTVTMAQPVTITVTQPGTTITQFISQCSIDPKTGSTSVATSVVTKIDSTQVSQPATMTTSVSQPVITGVATNLPPPPTGNNRTPQTPTKFSVVADEFVATLQWDQGVYTDFGMGKPDYAWNFKERLQYYNHAGYVILWGPVDGSSTPSKVFTPFQLVQLQPLVAGVTYFANVMALHVDGTTVYGPTANVTFQSDSTRVNGLRSTMTAFFDDFNIPAGPFNESRWNIAYSYCDFPMLSAAFVNNQLHAHQVVSSPKECEKGLVVARPRALFDFTGRTGTVVFDFDGAFGMSNWYLDLMPGDKIDIEGHIHIADPQKPGAPINLIRLRTKDQQMELVLFGSDGIEKILTTSPLDALGVPLVRNVRRPFVCKISTTLYQVFVSGKLVLSQPINLPYSVGTLHFTLYSYDTIAMDTPFATIHWDNFGFDGPAPTTITRNYIANGQNQANFVRYDQFNSPGPRSINVPDSLAGNIGGRLMWTANSYGNILAKDKVTINGLTFAFPIPVEGSLAQSAIINFESARAFRIDLTPAQVNALTSVVAVGFTTTNPVFIQNLHLEVDWSMASPPSVPYTAPIPWYGDLTNPSTNFHPVYATSQKKVGNNAKILSVGAVNIGYNEQITSFSNPTCVKGVAFPYWGQTVMVRGEVYTEIEMTAYGKTHPIKTVSLLANNQTIATWILPGTQSAFRFQAPLNTALFPPNSEIQLFPQITSSDGTPGLPNYQINMGGISCNGVGDSRLGSNTGDYLPIRIFVTP